MFDHCDIVNLNLLSHHRVIVQLQWQAWVWRAVSIRLPQTRALARNVAPLLMKYLRKSLKTRPRKMHHWNVSLSKWLTVEGPFEMREQRDRSCVVVRVNDPIYIWDELAQRKDSSFAHSYKRGEQMVHRYDGWYVCVNISDSHKQD